MAARSAEKDWPVSRKADIYDKTKEDEAFRRERLAGCGFGFKPPSVVPNVAKMAENEKAAETA